MRPREISYHNTFRNANMQEYYIIYFFISAILGFFVYSLLSGKREGEKLNRSFRFLVGKHRIHIHHWIYCSVILTIFLLSGIYNPITLGLLSGSIFQGLLYKDRFIVFYKDSDFNKIYSKFKNSIG